MPNSNLSDERSLCTDGEIPLDGVYYRAPGVTTSLRSFPDNGPVNCYLNNFINADAYSKVIPRRVLIPVELRPWQVPFEKYDPEEYITESVLANCRNRNPKGYADPEPAIVASDPSYVKLFKPFNSIWLRGLSRSENGALQHPYGRVGIKGQGALGNRHVNEAIDPVTVFLDPDTGVVKVLIIKRNPRSTIDTTWAVPGGMVDFKPEKGTYSLPRPLVRVLTEMKMSITEELQDSDNNFKENCLRELNEETGFSGQIVYQKLIAQMYCDDSRNTDTTWIGTTVFLLIPEKFVAVRADGVETAEASWVPVLEAMTYEFFASHRYIIGATLRYYVTNSFHDRALEGTAMHRIAYDYLKGVVELELPSSFDDIVKKTTKKSECCTVS